MKAKSEALRDAATGRKSAESARPKAGRKRLPHAERKAQILKTATEFFADNGLTAQTRRLADECGISQRLLYRFFPTKEDLLDEVYRQEILGVFKPTWFAELQDRSRPAEKRIILFYEDYLKVTLTRKWLRLFMYASLSEARMAPDYISAIVTHLMEVIVREVAEEKAVTLPDDRTALHEMGWTLHGAISHYAIRRHLYKASNILPEQKVIAMHVRTFMVGFESMVQDYADHLD
ncbi:TetR/AcrR family transcriptional regulator [Thetidibacter halocola]|uniref:TetR/AcrR family transcriptional regulator n=1 Tax=Thetidibacter halocola TaxID=2827239 RepID=A0A8J7WHG5_9RHOB|nr:TetR/AcrR family transcriptional regulator [Thetidibacter halocola]MBS0126509.1 TetR/AcrR family transcriptional regulator [Thetidibacter halocola]